MPPDQRFSALSAAARRLAIITVVFACNRIDATPSDGARGPLVRGIARSPLPRRWAARLSVPTTSVSCDLADSLPRLRCPATDAGGAQLALVGTARLAAETIERNADPDALHAAALIGLSSSDESGKAIERSVSYLEMLTRMAPGNSGAYTDLSAVNLALAAGVGGARSLVAALDAAGRALELDGRDQAALFNRALALDMLGLNGQASEAWRRYVALDSSSEFAREARTRLETIARYRNVQEPSRAGSATEYGQFASRSPAEARVFVVETLLSDWGKAVLGQNTATAHALLSRASVMADTLAMDEHDWSAADAIRSINGAERKRALVRRLAVLHAMYAEAQAHVHASDYPPADSSFVTIVAARPLAPALAALAAYGHANALIYQHRPVDALNAADSLIRSISDARYPSIVANAYWIRGLLLLRASKTDDGIESIHRARQRYLALGDRERGAAAVGIEGEVMLQQGRSLAGFTSLNRAAIALRAYPHSLWRHNVLVTLARAATNAGWPLAARAIEDEDMETVAGGRPTSVVEAKLARARSDWSAGHRSSADSALEEATRALARVADTNSRTQLQKELELTIATRLIASKPDSARVLLDSAIAFFAPLHFPMKLIPSLLARSNIAVQRGDPKAALADLDRAASTYLQARTEIAAAAQAAALLARARDAFNSLIMLEIGMGHANDALGMFVKSRGAFTRGAGSPAMLSRGDREAVVAYALVGDTLLTWTTAGRDTSFRRAIVRETSLSGQIERLRSAMELGARQDAVGSELENLYEILVRPVENHIPPTTQSLTILTDEELSAVPFAALRDSRGGTYLVERYALRFAPTTTFALKPTSSTPTHALFVASPALDPTIGASLPALSDAVGEAQDAATEYPGAVILQHEQADSASVVSGLQRASLFHFAGHAVFDDAEPDRSYLALGSRGLSASVISSLDLSRLDLVVLSACETMRSRATGGSGFFGLSEAFLSAGARGVVGTTWRVDDQSARLLMREFHRAYRRSGDGATSLRDAQLSMIRAKGRPPSVWAGFRYSGL